MGRQLFVDDFLIESNTLSRVWHKPVKHSGNPILKPEKPWEMCKGLTPMAAPFSDGCFYDPKTKRFMLWYSAGWYDSTALAVSEDGVNWTEITSVNLGTHTRLVLALALLLVSEPYRLQRLTSFTDPWADQYDTGYQLTQSLIAFGRGEWLGVGLGNSVQKLFYLPEAHTDFVFAIWAEETGVVGALLLAGLMAVGVYIGQTAV